MLKHQYLGHLKQRANSLEEGKKKKNNLGKIEGKRKRGWQKMKWFDSITDSVDMKVKVKLTQLCPTICNTMAYTVHGIL